MSANTEMNTAGFTVQCKPGCRHDLCKNCSKPFRLFKQLLKDHPGTVVGVKRDRICVGCRQVSTRNGVPGRSARPPQCLGCNHKLMPAKASPEDYPGAVIHQSRGLCRVCFHKTPPDEREALLERYESQKNSAEEDARLENAARGVYDLMAGRRRRGVPRHGNKGPVKIV